MTQNKGERNYLLSKIDKVVGLSIKDYKASLLSKIDKVVGLSIKDYKASLLEKLEGMKKHKDYSHFEEERGWEKCFEREIYNKIIDDIIKLVEEE